MQKTIQLTLLTKPGCHLCEEAKTGIDQVLEEFALKNSASVQIELSEVNILDDPELLEKHSEEIPVLQIDGQTHGYWRIDPARLLAALEQKL